MDNHFNVTVENTTDAETNSPFSELLGIPALRKQPHIHGILIGTVIQADQNAIQIRSLEGDIFSAIAACSLSENDLNKQCAFMLSETLTFNAVVIGLLQNPVAKFAMQSTVNSNEETEIHYPDGLRITCGESSLTLNPDGKVEIRGTRIINQASEVHRIKAASVRIN